MCSQLLVGSKWNVREVGREERALQEDGTQRSYTQVGRIKVELRACGLLPRWYARVGSDG